MGRLSRKPVNGEAAAGGPGELAAITRVPQNWCRAYAMKGPPLPPCPKCGRNDHVSEAEQSGSSQPWYECALCGIEFTAPSKPSTNRPQR